MGRQLFEADVLLWWVTPLQCGSVRFDFWLLQRNGKNLGRRD
jgi:hypothetical protein